MKQMPLILLVGQFFFGDAAPVEVNDVHAAESQLKSAISDALCQQDRAGLVQAVNRYVDEPALLGVVMGEYWQRMSLREKDKLQEEFRLTLARYIARVVEEFPAACGSAVDVVRVSGVGEWRTVFTRMSIKGVSIPVDFRMRDTSGDWRIVDVRAMGVSFSRLKRADYKRTLESQGGEGLWGLMRDKNSDFR